MDFYRARRNSEIKSDGFVRQALGQALEDVLLARRESRDEDSRIGRPARPAFGIGKALKGGFDGRDQHCLLERLFQEIDRPGLHRLNGDRDIAMTGQNDDGHGYATRVQFLLDRSEEHTSELQSLMRISYAVFCLKKKNT